MNIAYRTVSFLIGYCFGLILVGFFLGKLSNIDLRTKGSGNVGTTNTTRVLGAKKGLITLLCDTGKGFAAAGMVWLIFHTRADVSYEELKLLLIYAAFGAVIGHDFPFYMKFKGGKGVATSLSFLAMVNPIMLLLAVVFFVGAMVFTRYVSLGSILGAVAVIVYTLFFNGLGSYTASGGIRAEVTVMVLVAASILLIRHRENIKRLLAGEESRFSLKHKTERNGNG